MLATLVATTLAASDPIPLPIEVMGPVGTLDTIRLAVPNGTRIATIRLQIHNLGYQDKVGVQVGLRNEVLLANGRPGVTVLGRANEYGGIGGS